VAGRTAATIEKMRFEKIWARARFGRQTVISASHESDPAKFDVCGLIKKQEIEAPQGSPIKETKNSE